MISMGSEGNGSHHRDPEGKARGKQYMGEQQVDDTYLSRPFG